MGLRKRSIAAPHIALEPGFTSKHKKARRHAAIEEHDVPPKCPPKKRVRFSQDGSGAVISTERASDIVHADLDKPNLWWTRKERANILEECQETIKDFRSDHMDQVQHYIGVFDKCCDSLTQSSSDYLETATVALPTDVRGLEWGIAPQTKNHRREHVRDILDVQDRVQTLTILMRDRFLSSQSLRSSRRCLLMARLLGEGDKVPRDEGTQRKRRHQCATKSRS